MASAEPIGGERTGGPRSRKGALTRARLVEAARAVFEESGFLDARISDIADRAGLSQGSFYHYFESKEEIFREVAELQAERMSEHSIVDSHLLERSGDLSTWDRLYESNRVFLSDYREEARLMGLIEQVSRYDPKVQAGRFSRQKIYVKRAAQAIRSMQQAGRADPGLDPDILAWALSAMVSRFAELWLVQGFITCPFDLAVEQVTLVCANALGLKEKGRGVRSRSGREASSNREPSRCAPARRVRSRPPSPRSAS